MTALAESQTRIVSIGKLKTVVGAMRGIAATHAQQARNALRSFRAYQEVVADGLARAIQLLDPAGLPAAQPIVGRPAVIVYTAEHGFAGSFSERVLDTLAASQDGDLFLLGSKGLSLAERRKLSPVWSAPMASQASGVDVTARRVADALYAGFTAGRFARADMVFTREVEAGAAKVVRQQVLPLDLTPFKTKDPGSPPLANLPPQRLVEQLVGEYVFATLALAALESFTSENGARLRTMESARLNIDDKLDELSRQERLLRQEQITAEVQEITSGALAAETARRA